jgi:hypothetical protein
LTFSTELENDKFKAAKGIVEDDDMSSLVQALESQFEDPATVSNLFTLVTELLEVLRSSGHHVSSQDDKTRLVDTTALYFLCVGEKEISGVFRNINSQGPAEAFREPLVPSSLDTLLHGMEETKNGYVSNLEVVRYKIGEGFPGSGVAFVVSCQSRLAYAEEVMNQFDVCGVLKENILQSEGGPQMTKNECIRFMSTLN